MQDMISMVQDGLWMLLQLGLVAGLWYVRRMSNAQRNYYSASRELQRRNLLQALGREAFAQAESIHRGMDGPAKMNEAIKYLYAKCDSCGMGDIDMSDARAVIEAAWLDDSRRMNRELNVQVPADRTSPAEWR